MGKLDQLVKRVFLEDTSPITGDSLVFSVPPESRTTEVTADGLLTVVRPEAVAGLPHPWRLVEGPEAVLEFKMQADKLDRPAVERARLRRQARQVLLVERDPGEERQIPLWMVSGAVPRWIRGALEPGGPGVYRLPHEPFLWVASNELPLDPALIPFLVTRTGRRLPAFMTWLLDVRPLLCKDMIEVVPMSTPEYDEYEEQIEAITEEEHQRRLTRFATNLATKLGIVDAARVEATRQALLDLAAARGLALTEADQARVLAESDLERLRQWLQRAAVADTVAQVF